MQNGAVRPAQSAESHTLPVAHDARSAILMAEGAIARSLDVGATVLATALADPRHNAFGDPVLVEAPLDAAARVRRAAERISSGDRIAVLASTAELSPARETMAEMVSRRLAAVFHLLEPVTAEAALAWADLGWALLFASGVEESFDLTLVARRAAEDSGTPFLVVHDLAHARCVEPLAPLDAGLVRAFVGSPDARLHRVADPGHPSHAQIDARGFAERVPFALASALRELEVLTGRKRDAVTRSASGADASLMLVGLGALGDVLLGEVPRLRASGHDVGAVKVTSLRPFPGPRAVRFLSRALAVTVLEHSDTPLAQSNPLTREVKSSFADALTWAPDYPGVGRVPRIHSGVVGLAAHDLEARDLDAVVRNMLEGESGKRFFVLGGAPLLDLTRGAAERTRDAGGPGVFQMRGILRDTAFAATAAELAAVVIARTLALKVRACIRPVAAADGGGGAFDLVASPDRPIGVHLAPAVTLVALDDASSLVHGNPLARLADGGTVAVPTKKTSAEAVWADMPPYAKAIVFDRHARLIGWELEGHPTSSDEEARWLAAAAFTGVALAALAPPSDGRPALDGSLVAREVGDVVRARSEATDDVVLRAGETARRAFEASVPVPRGLVEHDEEGVRLGRKDARAAVA